MAPWTNISSAAEVRRRTSRISSRDISRASTTRAAPSLCHASAAAQFTVFACVLI